MTFNGGDPSGDGTTPMNVFAGVSPDQKWLYKSMFHSDGKQKSINGTFTVSDEDSYTLGELLKHEMANHKDVLSQGYIVPHPLEPVLKIHCRTKDTTTPPIVLDQCFSSILKNIKEMKAHLDSFSSQAKLAKENKGSTSMSVT